MQFNTFAYRIMLAYRIILHPYPVHGRFEAAIFFDIIFSHCNRPTVFNAYHFSCGEPDSAIFRYLPGG
jgi:hypothetical protein